MISNQKISIKQIMILLILDMFGAASLVTPRIAVEYGEQDGWILIIVAGLLAMIYGWVITKLTRMFPHKTFTEYTEEITSKFFAILLSILFLIKLLIIGSFELRIFGELTNQMLLNRTPIEVVLLLILLVSVYLARKGYEVRARVGELLIYMAFIPIVIVFGFGLFSVELTNLAPFFVAEYKEIINGSYAVSLRFLSIELILIAAAFLTEPQKITKASLKSIGIVTVMHLVIYFVTIGTFGVRETANHIWPVIPMMKVINLPQIFVDRQDALMMTFWMFTAFVYFNGIVFFSSFLIQDILGLKYRDYIVLPLVLIFYVLALIPDNIIQTYNWMNTFLLYGGLSFSLVVPLILLAIAKFKKLGDAKDENETD